MERRAAPNRLFMMRATRVMLARQKFLEGTVCKAVATTPSFPEKPMAFEKTIGERLRCNAGGHPLSARHRCTNTRRSVMDARDCEARTSVVGLELLFRVASVGQLDGER